MILLFAVLFALSLSCASALEDNNATYNEDIKNFTSISHLNEEIDNSSGYLNLTKDYAGNNDEKVILNKSVTIEGNSHSLYLNSTGFEINNDSAVVFKNINFTISNNVTFNTTANITFIDCIFNYNNISNCANAYIEYSWSYVGAVPESIVKLAKEIVGKSKDLAAAKKLAIWVGKNIKHESNAGFYQSPVETLNRKKGNCCCQTDLFLQMCHAVGITKNHKVCYVHTGNILFGQRHFYAMIDNLCIDVDARPTNPWGHANDGRRVFAVTEYPMLPLVKEYY